MWIKAFFNQAAVAPPGKISGFKIFGFGKAGPFDFHTYLSKINISFLLVIILISAMPKNNADPDLWGYLAFGRLFWETSGFPYRDIFSYVPTKDIWIYHEWLTGAILYPIYAYIGDLGLQAVNIAAALATVALICATAYQRGAHFWGIVIIIFLIKGFLTLGYSPVRAQIFTYFFFSLSLFILEKSRRDQTWPILLWLIPIQILWCNLHGGFLAGLGLIAIYFVGEALSNRTYLPYLAALILSCLATLINPYGIRYWMFIYSAASMPRPEISEWASVLEAFRRGLYQGNAYLFILAVVVTVFLIWLTKWKDLTAGLALSATGYLGFQHTRHQVFFLLLAGAYMAGPLSIYLKNLINHYSRSGPLRYNRKILIISYIVVLLFFITKITNNKPLSLSIPSAPMTKAQIFYPVGGLEFIRSHFLSGKLLTEFSWGEYLLWNLYPQCQVAVDGRYETVYPETVMQKFWIFINGRQGWENFLEEYPPNMILIRSDSKMCNILESDQRWRQIYKDPGCALFVTQNCDLTGQPLSLRNSMQVERN